MCLIRCLAFNMLDMPVMLEMQFQYLKRRGLLEDVDMTSQRVYVHDLYREFAELESKGKLNESADFEKRKWVYYENAYPAELEMTPSHRCWQNLIRVAILKSESSWSRMGFLEPKMAHDLVQSFEGIEWRYFSNVVVLGDPTLRATE